MGEWQLLIYIMVLTIHWSKLLQTISIGYSMHMKETYIYGAAYTMYNYKKHQLQLWVGLKVVGL